MKHLDMTGMKYGRWTVISRAANTTNKITRNGKLSKGGETQWNCRCECGTERVVKGWHLRTDSRSCGCFHREQTGLAAKVHGKTGSPEYRAYQNAKRRCSVNPDSPDYPNYYARGIRFNFKSFAEFYREIGDKPDPSYSLDRIDNNGNYEAGNIQWVSRSLQIVNQRKKVRLQNLPTGVLKHKLTWSAQAALGDRYLRRNRLKSEAEAAEAYNELIQELHGIMTKQNHTQSVTEDVCQ